MFGVVYFKHSDIKNEFVAYSSQTGFLKEKNLNAIKEKNDVIWISNLEKNSDLENIKKENFLGIFFDEIIYYFNIFNFSLPYKIKKITEVFNNTLDYVDSSNVDASVDDLLKCDSFFEVFKNPLNKRIGVNDIKVPDFFFQYEYQSNIHLGKNAAGNKTYAQVNEIKLIECLKKMLISFNEWELFELEDVGAKENDVDSLISISNDYNLIPFAKIKNGEISSLIARKENGLLTFNELCFLNACKEEISVKKIFTSPSKVELQNVLSYIPKSKKTNISNRIAIRGFISKLLSVLSTNKGIYNYIMENIKILNFKNVYFLKRNNIHVSDYNYNELIVEFGKDHEEVVNLFESCGLLYSSNLLKFLIE